jgi:hypothetical protein
MWQNILSQAMDYLPCQTMVCSKMNNGLLTINMGLAKKASKNNMFEKKIVN